MVNGADLFVMADIRGGAAEKGRTGYNSSDIALAESTAELLAPFPAAPPLQRSNSVFDTERKQPRHWLRRSLPPAKRERHRENAKSSGTPKEEYSVEPKISRSKSANFKRSTADPSVPRSLSFASGSRVRKARRAQEEDTDGELGFLSLYRRASIRSILPVVQQIKDTESRKWTVAIFSLVAAILASLRGFTLAFSSNATLDLTGAVEQLPSNYLFSTALISIFAVRFGIAHQFTLHLSITRLNTPLCKFIFLWNNPGSLPGWSTVWGTSWWFCSRPFWPKVLHAILRVALPCRVHDY